MPVHTQFSIAVHLMAALGYGGGAETSGHLARSVNASPSFVRRVLAKLSKAGLVRTTTGKSGSCALARDARRVTLLDIYEAIEAPKVFAIHKYPELRSCPVSRRIKPSLERILGRTQRSMEQGLRGITLAAVLDDIGG